MEIQNEKKVLRGKHNEQEFILDGGVLEYMGQRWDQTKVKSLIDLCNLLKIEGYELTKKTQLISRSNIIMWPSLRNTFDTEEDI